MFTVCPKCALTLVVTAPDLRIAQGYVRCGRCLNVFNALARLSEERPAAPAPEPEPTAASESAAAPEPAASEEPAAAQEPADTAGSEPPHEASPPPRQPAPLPEPIASSDAGADAFTDDTGEIEIELDAGNVFVTSTRPPAVPVHTAQRETPAEDLDVPLPAAPVPDASEPAPAATVVTEDDPAETRAPVRALPVPSSPEVASDEQQTNTPSERPEGAFELASPRPRAGRAWALGAAALALALALQVVNHYRDALAADPMLRGPLGTVYSALGVKLAPRWNIHAYDVRQLGASVTGTAAGEIVVRASVKNSASRAQPLPLLRVTLQDRFGNRIAARDVPPGDYLPSSVAADSLLAAGDRVDATMVFVDPGPQAVGFEIDACLRRQSGEVACAHGQ